MLKVYIPLSPLIDSIGVYKNKIAGINTYEAYKVLYLLKSVVENNGLKEFIHLTIIAGILLSVI